MQEQGGAEEGVLPESFSPITGSQFRARRYQRWLGNQEMLPKTQRSLEMLEKCFQLTCKATVRNGKRIPDVGIGKGKGAREINVAPVEDVALQL